MDFSRILRSLAKTRAKSFFFMEKKRKKKKKAGAAGLEGKWQCS
jgi:hypothetical protein